MAEVQLSFLYSLAYALLSLVLLIASVRYRRLSTFCVVAALASLGSLVVEAFLALVCLLWMTPASSPDPMTPDKNLMLIVIRMSHLLMNSMLALCLIGLMSSLSRQLKTSPRGPAPLKRTPPSDTTVELTLAD